MKKLFAVILMIAVTLSAGCGTAPQTSSGDPSDPSVEFPEKQLLKLVDFTENDDGFDSAENIEISRRDVDIPLENFRQTAEKLPLSSVELPEELMSEITKDFPNALDPNNSEGWKYTANMIADDGSLGMVRLLYHIGDIATNKAVTLTVENGRITGISYTNMSYSLNNDEEQALIDRARRFTETHEQEKREFAEGERLVEERTTFTYYYNVATLRYTYALFFEYGQPPIINNNYGTEVTVD